MGHRWPGTLPQSGAHVLSWCSGGHRGVRYYESSKRSGCVNFCFILLFPFEQQSFSRAKTWVKELQRQASPNIVIALAGNKTDLASKRTVETEEAQAYADENGLLFMETSAKTAMNVNDIFLAIAKKLPKNDLNAPGAGGAGGSGRRIDLNDNQSQSSSGNMCCKSS